MQHFPSYYTGSMNGYILNASQIVMNHYVMIECTALHCAVLYLAPQRGPLTGYFRGSAASVRARRTFWAWSSCMLWRDHSEFSLSDKSQTAHANSGWTLSERSKRFQSPKKCVLRVLVERTSLLAARVIVRSRSREGLGTCCKCLAEGRTMA